jgi:uncharacterized protein
VVPEYTKLFKLVFCGRSMVVKGEVLGGDFDKILMRVKSDIKVELGEILAIDINASKVILVQVYDLVYASQISNSNLEMISGMRMEEGLDVSMMDAGLRNYMVAYLKPLLISEIGLKSCSTCKELPKVFSKVRKLVAEDLVFMTKPQKALYLGNLRSGSQVIDYDLYLPGEKVYSHHMLVAASTGKGKSNLMKDILGDSLSSDYVGMLVLDPHDEYYGRVGLGLKDHPNAFRNQDGEGGGKVVYYTPASPPPGARTLVFSLSILKPEYFNGALALSQPQRQLMFLYHKQFGENWIEKVMQEKRIEGASFHPDTVAVVKRKLMSLLNLDVSGGVVSAGGIFSVNAGENTIVDICKDLEKGRTVIVDTSYFSGSVEIMIGSMIASSMLDKYKLYKRQGELNLKPVISVVLEEAPRVLGKKVLEQGSNVFDTIAREGRKFKIGLVAITQLPSEIPKTVLANMNTKIILGMEMGPERQAIIESSAQDLRDSSRAIAALDKGEAIVTSTFTRFAVPIAVPLYSKFVEKWKKEHNKNLGDSGLGKTESGEDVSLGYIGFG